MRPVRRKLATTLVVLAALAGIAVGVPAAQAEPDPGPAGSPPCGWTAGNWGDISNCDGISHQSRGYVDYCKINAPSPVFFIDEIFAGGHELAEIYFTYHRGRNGSCRSAYATIVVFDTNAVCYVKLQRNSDGQAYRAYLGKGPFGRRAETGVLYDAGVTSYAWGTCTYNGDRYTARTPNY